VTAVGRTGRRIIAPAVAGIDRRTMDADSPDLREIGRIVRPHGVQGAFKVAPETDDPERFLALDRVFVGRDERSTQSFDIVSVRIQPSRYGQTVILELEGITDRTAAERMGKPRVFAAESDLPPLEEGEYFVDQLIGLEVDDGTGEIVGTVEDVLELPGQDRLLIRKTSGAEAMVPLVPDLVESIDFDEGVVRLVHLEGLL
jgi:16S rRNA processing protein RimM